MNRNSLVLPANPDQLTVNRPVFPEWSADNRLRSVPARKRDNDASGVIAQRAGRVVLAKHLVQVGKGLACVAWTAAVTHHEHAFADLWLGRRVNGSNKHRRAGLDAPEMNIRLFTQQLGEPSNVLREPLHGEGLDREAVSDGEPVFHDDLDARRNPTPNAVDERLFSAAVMGRRTCRGELEPVGWESKSNVTPDFGGSLNRTGSTPTSRWRCGRSPRRSGWRSR